MTFVVDFIQRSRPNILGKRLNVPHELSSEWKVSQIALDVVQTVPLVRPTAITLPSHYRH